MTGGVKSHGFPSDDQEALSGEAWKEKQGGRGGAARFFFTWPLPSIQPVSAEETETGEACKSDMVSFRFQGRISPSPATQLFFPGTFSSNEAPQCSSIAAVALLLE